MYRHTSTLIRDLNKQKMRQGRARVSLPVPVKSRSARPADRCRRRRREWLSMPLRSRGKRDSRQLSAWLSCFLRRTLGPPFCDLLILTVTDILFKAGFGYSERARKKRFIDCPALMGIFVAVSPRPIFIFYRL
jgi:hypothetical protein